MEASLTNQCWTTIVLLTHYSIISLLHSNVEKFLIGIKMHSLNFEIDVTASSKYKIIEICEDDINTSFDGFKY